MANIPVKLGKNYEIEIKGMGFEGEGVGRIENFAVFIPNAIEGEKVEVKINEVNKKFSRGSLLKVIKASKYRVKPSCSYYENCGGCQMQHISYEGQLYFKRKRVVDAVERIGKLKGVLICDVIGMDNPYRYRNKVQLPVGGDCKNPLIGFYSPKTHTIVDISNCLIQNEEGDKAIKIVKEYIKEFKIKPYDEKTGDGVLRHVMVRKGFKTDEVMVVLVTNGIELSNKDELIEKLKNSIDGLKSVVQNINLNRTNVVLGSENIVLYGTETISDYIGEFKFKISPNSFFQVNPIQTEKLYGKALEFSGLTGEETVFDAYCGTGTISLFLSKGAKKVYGVEVVEPAVENAKENAKNNNINNAEFLLGKSEEVIPEMIKKGIYADVVVVDPPRKGCEKSLLTAIAKMNPKRIVYVSCDPGTLARDLGILNDLSYNTKIIQPVDMFPNTAHVETVVLMSRVDK